MSIEVLNKMTATPEETPVINVALGNPIYRGPKGDKGDKGDRGEIGPIGLTGAIGPQGIQGEVGPKGDKGDQGVQGPKGDQGDKGETGNSGVYVGSTAPTDENIVVWIDMTGDAELEPAEGGSY